MNILIAMNAFKGTLTSLEVNQIIESYLKSLNHKVTSMPMSDGGDGFLDSISSVVDGDFIEVDALNPMGESIKSSYYLYKNTAYIELAKVSGLNLIKEQDRNPLKTSTYGLGLVIKQAIDQGAKHVYIGIGGSATNDGGAGMLQALGVKFYNEGNIINEKINGEMIGHITSFDLRDLNHLIKEIDIQVVSDVENPLLGKHGAAQVYASQKGASDEAVRILEKNMMHFADVVETYFKKNYRNTSGSGAAGGIGFGLLSFMQAHLNSGINYMIKLSNLEDKLRFYDIIVVGEGKLDQQTLFGKAPYGIAKIAKKYNKKVIGIFAKIDESIKTDVFDEIYAIVPYYESLEYSMINPHLSLKKMLRNICFK
ncbi:hypothetical protein BK011_02850 [Tenericutes bacterium MZ-XQ]|nr:hypothetical protein BK011_02850 [Tenericutes bacterium MZ-XQ]